MSERAGRPTEGRPGKQLRAGTGLKAPPCQAPPRALLLRSHWALRLILLKARGNRFGLKKKEVRFPQEPASEGPHGCEVHTAATEPHPVQDCGTQALGTAQCGACHRAPRLQQLSAPGNAFPEGILNMYAPKNSASKHLKQRSAE